MFGRLLARRSTGHQPFQPSATQPPPNHLAYNPYWLTYLCVFASALVSVRCCVAISKFQPLYPFASVVRVVALRDLACKSPPQPKPNDRQTRTKQSDMVLLQWTVSGCAGRRLAATSRRRRRSARPVRHQWTTVKVGRRVRFTFPSGPSGCAALFRVLFRVFDRLTLIRCESKGHKSTPLVGGHARTHAQPQKPLEQQQHDRSARPRFLVWVEWTNR